MQRFNSISGSILHPLRIPLLVSLLVMSKLVPFSFPVLLVLVVGFQCQSSECWFGYLLFELVLGFPFPVMGFGLVSYVQRLP